MTRLGKFVFILATVVASVATGFYFGGCYGYGNGYTDGIAYKHEMPEMPYLEVYGIPDAIFGESVCMSPETFLMWMEFTELLGEEYRQEEDE